MFTHTHLNLRSVKLEAPAEWVCRRKGLFFVFIKEGTGDCVSGPALQPTSAGDVLVLDGTAGSKLRVNQGRMVFDYFSAGLEHLSPLFVANEIGLLRNITNVFQDGKWYPASGASAQKCRQLLREIPLQFNLDHRSQLLRIAAAILAVELKTAQPERNHSVQCGEETAGVFGRLSTPELLNLSVGELASKYGCSRRHLNRLFHQHFGVSAAALKMEMRLLKAVALLRNSDTKIISVAEECGFNHLGVFNIRFKKRFGASPGQWRKMVIEVQKRPSDLDFGGVNCPLQNNGLCPLTPEERPSRRVGQARHSRSAKASAASILPAPLLCGITTLNSPKSRSEPSPNQF